MTKTPDVSETKARGFLLRHLSRESSTGQFIAEIDGLRFIAIMSVILYHLNGYLVKKGGYEGGFSYLSHFLNQGFFGVPLFFVISGFIISYPFARAYDRGREQPRLGKYYLRRLTRLEPPYIFNLVLIFILLVIVKGAPIGEYARHLAASIFYLHNQIYGNGSWINYVAWSLEIECQFYLLAPLIVSIFKMKSLWKRRLILATVIAVWSFVDATFLTRTPRVVLSLAYYGNYFLVGFLLVDFYVTDWKENPSKGLAWDFLGAAGWAGIVGLLLRDDSSSPFLPFLILLSYCGAFKGTYSNRFFRHPVIYVIGGMCYTIYLYHFHMISLIGRLSWSLCFQPGRPFWGNMAAVGAAAVPLTLVACAIMFVFFEKPFMKRDWYKKWIRS
ncbi:MAG: acyltransferase [Acidobacteriia bacterium]|nr:acyltransferase [Terriglobia bacterium]